jgi:hypothetical protein
MWKMMCISVIAGYLLAGCTTKYANYATEMQEKYTADANFCQGYGGSFTGCMSRRGWSQSGESQRGVRR